MEIKPNYFSIIPATVRYDNELKDKAKLLFSEITCLTNSLGYCVASNDYFANLYGVSKETISRLINQLAEKGYIKITYEKRGSQVTKRMIILSSDIQKCQRSNDEIIIRTDDENVKDNNTSINNNNSSLQKNESENQIVVDEVDSMNTKTNKSKVKKVFLNEDREYKLANYLSRQISKRLNTPVQKESTLQKWASEFERVVRLDERDIDEVKDVLIFSQQDLFWQTNIMSAKKFRQQYLTLLAKMKKEEKAS